MQPNREPSHDRLTPSQGQTGKGAHLRVARAGIGRPAKALADLRMQTGEVEAKVLVVGLKDGLPPAGCVAKIPESLVEFGAVLAPVFCGAFLYIGDRFIGL